MFWPRRARPSLGICLSHGPGSTCDWPSLLRPRHRDRMGAGSLSTLGVGPLEPGGRPPGSRALVLIVSQASHARRTVAPNHRKRWIQADAEVAADVTSR